MGGVSKRRTDPMEIVILGNIHKRETFRKMDSLPQSQGNNGFVKYKTDTERWNRLMGAPLHRINDGYIKVGKKK